LSPVLLLAAITFPLRSRERNDASCSGGYLVNT
jgi:hypothetical protein